MKKLVGASLFIFWAAVTAIIIAGLVFYQKNPNDNPLSPLATPSESGQIVLSSQEISKHNSVSDCWMIINGKVYNLSSYLGMHPGGSAPMLPYCGKDGSQAFITKDTGSTHSVNARSLLANYYIGDLNQTIGALADPGTGSLPAQTTVFSTPSPAIVSPTSTPMRSSAIILSAQEIVKHNTTNDCWLIISGKVYNVTDYFGLHPGGTGAISPYCGRDATQAFIGLPHSSYANSLLVNYLIGNLNQSVGTAQIQQNIQNTNQVTQPVGRNRDDEHDD